MAIPIVGRDGWLNLARWCNAWPCCGHVLVACVFSKGVGGVGGEVCEVRQAFDNLKIQQHKTTAKLPHICQVVTIFCIFRVFPIGSHMRLVVRLMRATQRYLASS